MDLTRFSHTGLGPLADATRAYISNARSSRTRATYVAQWKRFVAWCEAHDVQPMPAAPEVLAVFLTEEAQRGLKPSSIDLTACAISEAHRMAGQPTPRTAPVVRETIRGIKRTHGTMQKGRAPLSPEQMRDILNNLPDTLQGARNRALVLTGFLGGFRRSELVAMQVKHITFVDQGMLIEVFGSKDDRALTGREVAIPHNAQLCAVAALQAWLARASIAAGPIFRSVDRHGNLGAVLGGRDVARIVKGLAHGAGIEAGEISGHSLRSGFVTAAHLNGMPLESIMKVTGHRSYDTAMRYIRKADQFTQHPSKGLL